MLGECFSLWLCRYSCWWERFGSCIREIQNAQCWGRRPKGREFVFKFFLSWHKIWIFIPQSSQGDLGLASRSDWQLMVPGWKANPFCKSCEDRTACHPAPSPLGREGKVVPAETEGPPPLPSSAGPFLQWERKWWPSLTCLIPQQGHYRRLIPWCTNQALKVQKTQLSLITSLHLYCVYFSLLAMLCGL